MSALLKLLAPGMLSSIQDKGRLGFGSFGVPRSGAIDPVSLRLGNALVGNDPYEAAIEFRLMGPTITAKNGSIRVAIACHAEAELTAFQTDEKHLISPWQTVIINEGDVLKILALQSGATGYLCVEGGLDIDPILGSCSTYARAKMGSPLQANDELRVTQTAMPWQCERKLIEPLQNTGAPLHVILGPQDDYFSDEEINRFLKKGFKVSSDVDRMGIRLEGSKILALPEKGSDLISDGLVAGAIQVPGNGQPIILSVDCQSVGGYPKIATVVSADLHIMGQLSPGNEIQFEAVNLEQAQSLYSDRETEIQNSIATIQDYFGEGSINLEVLYNSNLVGGVVDARNPSHFPGHVEDK